MVSEPCPWVSLLSRCMDTPTPLDTEHLLEPLKGESPALYRWYTEHNRFADNETQDPT